MAASDLIYEKDEKGVDRIIEEKGNQFLALRMVRWKDNKDFKLDFRKYRLTEEGEIPLKGVSFSTEEGPGELTTALIEEGFGKAKEIYKSIKEKRPDVESYFINDYLNREDLEGMSEHLEAYPIEDDDTEEYYDPKELDL